MLPHLYVFEETGLWVWDKIDKELGHDILTVVSLCYLYHVDKGWALLVKLLAK